MKRSAPYAILSALMLFSSREGVPAFANDGAASVAVGGIQLKREARISMEKERLTISREKVTVEYEFLNATDEDISTEIAFPVPPYNDRYLDASFPKRLDDFRVWVDGREMKYETEAKAMLDRVDYTALLQKLGVDVASLGHFDFDALNSPEVEKLPQSQRDELKRLGLILDNGFMGWTVVKTYHWPQTFPAQKCSTCVTNMLLYRASLRFNRKWSFQCHGRKGHESSKQLFAIPVWMPPFSKP